jgi:hypothetical protein
MGNVYLSSNLLPTDMTIEDLRLGAQWLMNRLYAPEPFLERLRVLGENLPEVGWHRGPTRQEDLELWTRLRRSFAAMDEDEASLPVQALRAVKGKDPDHAVQALIFYRHVVGTLQHWGLRDLDLARCETFAEAQALADARRADLLQPT